MPETDTNDSRISASAIVALMGAVIVVAGSFGPWVTLGALTSSGTQNGNEGPLLIAGAAIAAMLLLFRIFRPDQLHWAAWLVFAVFALLTVASVMDYNNARERVDVANSAFSSTTGMRASVGWGLGCAILGAIVGLVASLGHAVTTYQNESERKDRINTAPQPDAAMGYGGVRPPVDVLATDGGWTFGYVAGVGVLACVLAGLIFAIVATA